MWRSNSPLATASMNPSMSGSVAGAADGDGLGWAGPQQAGVGAADVGGGDSRPAQYPVSAAGPWGLSAYPGTGSGMAQAFPRKRFTSTVSGLAPCLRAVET